MNSEKQNMPPKSGKSFNVKVMYVFNAIAIILFLGGIIWKLLQS